MKKLSNIYMGLVFLFLYAPILVLVIFSFNTGGSLSSYTGFSFKWYGELFHDSVALQSLKNSLFLAFSSAAIATVLGTFAALGLDRMKNHYLRATVESVTNIPMMNPDIVTGVSMMLFLWQWAGFLAFRNRWAAGPCCWRTPLSACLM